MRSMVQGIISQALIDSQLERDRADVRDWRFRSASDNIRQAMPTLHVTNGDIAAESLIRSGLEGASVPWRDLLHDGPVPADDDRAIFQRTRTAFIVGMHWATEPEVAAQFVTRDAMLDATGADDEVVLWFEPDLYDQLQLLQVLARLARRADDQRPRVTIAPADTYLGPLDADDYPPLYHERRDIGPVEFAQALAAWTAFTATTPFALHETTSRLSREIRAHRYAADPDVRLPYLAAALRRQIEEYPDTRMGLGRTERQLCEALAHGPMSLSSLYMKNQSAEAWVWLGDSTCAWYLERLGGGAHPVIAHADGTPLVDPTIPHAGQSFWQRTTQLTAFGRDVVLGRADFVQANGIDRWIGGVHCTTASHWRWDAQHHRVIAPEST